MFEPPPFDPREQPVVDPYPQTPETIARAKAERERALAEPCVCGVALKHHWNLIDRWIGCEGAKRQQLPPRNPEVYNDPHLPITAAVRRAMVDGTCGPRFEIEMHGYTNDEQVAIAATLARVAVAEYLKGLTR